MRLQITMVEEEIPTTPALVAEVIRGTVLAVLGLIQTRSITVLGLTLKNKVESETDTSRNGRDPSGLRKKARSSFPYHVKLNDTHIACLKWNYFYHRTH